MGAAGRAALLRGADIVADAVKATLGPRGRAVALERLTGGSIQRPLITADGATVAADIELADPFENLGARLLREAALSTHNAVGDGTTTATVLAQAILHAAGPSIAAGGSAMLLRAEIEAAAAQLDRALVALGRPIKSTDEIRWVAQVSAGDENMALAIGDAFARVGADGAVDVTDGDGFDVVMAIRTGLRLETGYVSRLFVTDPARGRIEFKEPHILITDQEIASARDLARLCDQLLNQGVRHLVLVAPQFRGDALEFLLTNTQRGVLYACPVRVPSRSERDREALDDLAVLTGATFLSSDSASIVSGATPEMLGRADRAAVTSEYTMLIGGRGANASIARRREQIQSQLHAEGRRSRREQLRKRLRELASEAATIEVGGATDLERETSRALVEDAVRATRAALAEGIVAGGGTVYLGARACLEGARPRAGDDGARILHAALAAPSRVLLENAGLEPAAILPALERQPYGQGYDVSRERFVDMFDAGIVDPVQVTRVALRNAVSVAVGLLTTETAIARIAPPPGVEADAATMLSQDLELE